MRATLALLTLTCGCLGCGGQSPVSPTAPTGPTSTTTRPPITPIQTAGSLIVFTEAATGFGTTDLRDAQDHILQFTTANDLLWTADGTRLPGFFVDNWDYPGSFFIVGSTCAEGCWLEVRFGAKDGQRRAYLTADYGHDNPGTLVNIEMVQRALVVTRTSVFVPGTFTLSGIVTERTPEGATLPVEGVSVSRLVVSGWRSAITDSRGFYQMPGMFESTDTVVASKNGYQSAETKGVSIKGDTRFDIQLVRR